MARRRSTTLLVPARTALKKSLPRMVNGVVRSATVRMPTASIGTFLRCRLAITRVSLGANVSMILVLKSWVYKLNSWLRWRTAATLMLLMPFWLLLPGRRTTLKYAPSKRTIMTRCVYVAVLWVPSQSITSKSQFTYWSRSSYCSDNCVDLII